MPRDPDANERTMVERIDPLLGAVLDRRYKIDFRIAAGGFGAIYRATHIKSGHEVALKILHPQLTTDAGVVARFRREGATMTTLRSPHTITAYELGEADDGTLYIVMELLRGESLFERFRSEGRFDWKRMVRIARAICHSLGEAHGLGIVHRDLKPTNVHLETKGEDPDFVKVLDFGIAKILHDSDFDSSDLTNAGQMIGTLDYMSPEQMVGGACTGQSDIYTLGILTYEMIAGVRPFAEARTAAAALAAILKTDPPPLSKRTPVPDELDRILTRCLERDPLKRYATVGDLAEDLDGLISAQDLDEVTRTVAMDSSELGPGGTKSGLDSAPRRSPNASPLQPPRPETDFAVTAPVPKFRRAPTPPPTGMPSASPFKTTLPGAQRPPNPNARPSQPRLSPATGLPGQSSFPPTPPAQAPSGPHPPPPFSSAPQPQHGGLSPRFPPTPMAGPSPSFPPTPMAGQSPYAQNFPPTPMAGQPYAPQPIDDGRGSRPVLDLNAFPQQHSYPGDYPQAPGAGYDMGHSQARDAALRRWVWIAVLVVAAIVGVVLAAQL